MRIPSHWLAILLCLPMLQARACPTPPAAERDLKANSFYADSSGSIIDADKLARYKADAAPVDNFLRKVAQMASDYQAGDEAAGRCAMTWLVHWAENDALLGKAIGGSQAEFLRKWTLAGLAAAYLKVQPVATAAERQQITQWFPAMAEFGLAVFRDPRHKKNNHYYWVGLAVLGAGIAANDAKLIDTARGIYDKALADIGDDGTLPLEMARASRALHYHNYAMEPLVLMAEEARLLGEDWYARQDRRLDRLARRIVAGLDDPQWFATRTGKKQEIPHGNQLGWMLLYRKAAPESAIFDNRFPTGEVSDSRLGGSLSRLAEKGFPSRP
ncbi:MAG: Alginate lyase precursor [Proteobacteria bacterium]|nr:Alginate lyase precursor [Pseudomonadota bacterium]